MTATMLKKKRRKMKQMQGLLLLARLQHPVAGAATNLYDAQGNPLFTQAKKVLVVLQPQQLQLAYSAQDDQDMTHILGRIDLRGAKLEQLPDGFIIHEGESSKVHSKFKLQDRDKATTDAWFYGVYAAITEFTQLPIPASEDHSQRYSAILSASLRDEVTDELEFELSCQLNLPARPIEKPSIRWKIWKTFAQLQAFDDELRITYGSHMKRLEFPRERKRDSLFGGLRKKSKQDLKHQQLAVYIDKVFEIPGIYSETTFLKKARRFLGFDSFFVIKASADNEENDNQPDIQQEQLQQYVAQVQAEPVSDDSEPNSPPQSSNYNGPPSQTMERSSSSYDFESRRASLGAVDVLPPLSRNGSSAHIEDVGTEYVEIVPETDPKAAKKLHKQIIQRVRELVAFDEDRVRDFQDQTKYFGRDEMSATEYCAFLLGAFGAKECCQIIPMMARLLPDDVKRNELMDGRSAIWRRTIRRNRRRSKQFSESVAFQQQRNEVVHEQHVVQKMRPKSEVLPGMNWNAHDRDLNQVLPSRNSMLEIPSRSSFLSTSSNNQDNPIGSTDPIGSSDRAEPPAHKKPLLDPRRKLQHRASFNYFVEPASDPIQEETSMSYDSDDNNNNGNQIPEPTAVRVLPSLERKSSLAGGHRWSHSSQNRLSNADTALEDHYSAEYGGDDDSNAPVDYRHRRSSVKSELEAAHQPAPVVEENPVLARLRKQGAINFMMR
ncbi:hypothetical protein FI667_g8535, partial [Globisporangium splendens]